MKKRFYMLSLRDTVGSNASFHCKDGNGYNTNIDKAHVYNLEEAQSDWNNGRDIDLPVDADAVDALAVYHVDHQHVPCVSTVENGCTQYVAFVKGQWDGNDLYWVTGVNMQHIDFNQAAIFTTPALNIPGVVWLPLHTADTVKRRTFNINLLNRRTMIQGAGLLKPEWLKRHDRRKTSCKIRWNCPSCGKISWQFNPYDFDGCRDFRCDAYRVSREA
ncbi:hypothetical protein AI2795V1_4694 (plasmid) [Serratia marcescens]|uniref:hypothetical protein n=1 Tax=Serratia marcescens TaxID=615 RepID=UPI001D9772DD|nr:hypothetical protein [Serratia marcescens]CAE7797817.1 hypothetical protein AI2795V1_4694 [Serratia marcescens]CAH3928836.1 hypothetical protein AI2795V1_4694 [Serratia marcescens]